MCREVVVADSSPIPSRRQKRRFRSISVPRATFSAIIDTITSVKLFARSDLCNRSPRIRITRVSLLCLLLASGFVSSGSLSRLLTSDTSLLFRPSNYYTYTRVHSRTERLEVAFFRKCVYKRELVHRSSDHDYKERREKLDAQNSDVVPTIDM